MHEMSLITSLLDIVRDEMHKHGVTRLYVVRVRHGALSNVVPEAMTFAFEALTAGTPFEGAVLETELVPLELACGACGVAFVPEGADIAGALYAVCPVCGATFGHSVTTGKELYVVHIEAE